jgi:hypothetical protein
MCDSEKPPIAETSVPPAPEVTPKTGLREFKEYTAFLGALVDSAHTQYQVEWQRIGNMQQSAGALVAAMAIAYSALLAFIILPADSPFIKDVDYLNKVILPGCFVGLFFLSLTTYFFFRVIWPKDVKGLPPPTKLAEQLADDQLWKNLSDLIRRTNGSITDLDKLVQSKQLHYRRALISCSTAFSLTLLIVSFLLYKASWFGTKQFFYYFLLSAGTFIVLLIIFTRRPNGDL